MEITTFKSHHAGCTFCGTCTAWVQDGHQTYRIDWTNDGSQSIPGAQISKGKRRIETYMHVCKSCFQRLEKAIAFMEELGVTKLHVDPTPRKPAGS